MAYCMYCGAELDNDASFCHMCGEKTGFSQSEVQTNEKNDLITPKKSRFIIHFSLWYVVGMLIALGIIVFAFASMITQKNNQIHEAYAHRVNEDNITSKVYIDYKSSNKDNYTFVYDEISMKIPKRWGEPTLNAPYCYFYPNGASIDGMIMVYAENCFGEPLDLESFSEIEKGIASSAKNYSRINRSKYESKESTISDFYILDYKASYSGELFKLHTIIFEYNGYIYYISMGIGDSKEESLFDIDADLMDSVMPIK